MKNKTGLIFVFCTDDIFNTFSFYLYYFFKIFKGILFNIRVGYKRKIRSFIYKFINIIRYVKIEDIFDNSHRRVHDIDLNIELRLWIIRIPRTKFKDRETQLEKSKHFTSIITTNGTF